VALGTYGTTLSDELNRLANGGTYREPGAMVGQALAARQWAEQLSISTNLTDTVGVLNAIAETSSSNRLDFNGVCNLLAGTSGLPAAAALRLLDVTPPLPVVTGGTLTSDSTYFYRTFTSTSDLVVSNSSLAVEYLVIAGGAGARSGAGGAGGLRSATATLTPATYSAVVGAGSAGGDWATPLIALGSPSSFNGVESAGGGNGGTVNSANAQAGGSGGGGGGIFGSTTPGGAGNTPSTSPSQGNNGGGGGPSSNQVGGGGGGAGGVGGTPTAGVGSSAFSDWATATSTGLSGVYAAGGSGMNANATGAAGAINTGNGGSGGFTGGSGGSGIVIVRYLKTAV